jgi:4-aminobutyrate aminotransferase-like enzyme
MTLDSVPKDFLKELKALCKKTETFLVYNETAAKEFSFSDEHYFPSNDHDITPDAAFSFLGGQAGIVYLKEELFIAKPLMMISTWDGDEHAFASFHKGMKETLENKEEFLKVRSEFSQEIEKELDQFPKTEFFLEKGRGHVKGSLPSQVSSKLSLKSGRFIIDPSFTAMKKFLKRAKMTRWEA